MDVEFMKALQDKVNVVPLIAKADCLTPTEMKKLKERVKCSTRPQIRNNPIIFSLKITEADLCAPEPCLMCAVLSGEGRH